MKQSFSTSDLAGLRSALSPEEASTQSNNSTPNCSLRRGSGVSKVFTFKRVVSPKTPAYADLNIAVVLTMSDTRALSFELVKQLLSSKEPVFHEIRLVDTESEDVIAAAWKGFSRVHCHSIDLSNTRLLTSCFRDVEFVFDLASCRAPFVTPKSDSFGPFICADFGDDMEPRWTDNVIGACCVANVSRLVYLSTVDVLADGRKLNLADETTPYADGPNLTRNQHIQIAAERAVLAGNGQDNGHQAGLMTLVIRPGFIYGRDTPTPLEPARSAFSRLPAFVTPSDPVRDFVYTGNVAHGCILGALSLKPFGDTRGQIYHITDDSRLANWQFLAAFHKVDSVADDGVEKSPVGQHTFRSVRVAPWTLPIILALLYLGIRVLCALRASWAHATRAAWDCFYTRVQLTLCHDKAAHELGYRPIYDMGQIMQRINHLTTSTSNRHIPLL